MGEKLLNEGFQPKDFSMPGGDNSAYFGKQSELRSSLPTTTGRACLRFRCRKM